MVMACVRSRPSILLAGHVHLIVASSIGYCVDQDDHHKVAALWMVLLIGSDWGWSLFQITVQSHAIGLRLQLAEESQACMMFDLVDRILSFVCHVE